jgi:glycosyltransferase involved in cell wall biosynthesis
VRYLAICDYSLAYTAGAQTAFFRSIEALIANGDEVMVVGSDSDRALLPTGAQVRHLHRKRLRVPPIQFPVYVNNKRLRTFFEQLADDFNPDALICHSEYGLAVTACEVFQARKVPVLFVVHSFFITVGAPLPWPHWLAKLLFRRVINLDLPNVRLARGGLDNALQNATLGFAHKANLVISPSQHQAQSMHDAGAEDVRVLSNVTEIAADPRPLPEFGVLKVAWVGRFAPEKRLEVALDATRIAKAELDRLGVGGDKLELHVLGGEAKPDPVAIWHGKLPASEVGDVMAACHAVVMTSYNFDNQPMVILEALAQGRPVVLSDPKLAREFGEASVLADDHTAEGLARTFVRLTQHQDALLEPARAAVERAKLSSGFAHSQRMRQFVAEVQGRG